MIEWQLIFTSMWFTGGRVTICIISEVMLIQARVEDHSLYFIADQVVYWNNDLQGI